MRRTSPRNASIIMDWIHIVIGFLVVLLAVIVFLNPEGRQFLLPFIFLLAGVLYICNGVHKYRLSGRDKKKKAWAVAQFVLAGILLVITVISAVSLWR